MCYIFERHGIQLYQLWHSRVFKDVNYNHHIISSKIQSALHISTFLCTSLHFSTFICISHAILCISLHFFVYLYISQGGTKRCSAVATLHKNLSFGQKSWPPTYAVLSQNCLCRELSTYELRLSSEIFVWDFRLISLSETFISDFCVRFLCEIFV